MSQFSPDLILIDVNALGFASIYEKTGELTHNGVPTGAIHGTTMSVFARMKRSSKAMPLIIWDGSPVFRRSVLPSYKEHRTSLDGLEGKALEKQLDRLKMRALYLEQVPKLRELFAALGIPQVICKNAEADDVAGHIVRTLEESHQYSGLNLTLLTKDTDWLQCLREGIVWESPFRDAALSLNDLSNPEIGYKPGQHYDDIDQYIWAKALAGDPSDNIEGVSGVGVLTALKYLRQYKSMESFWREVDAGKLPVKGKIMEKLAAQETRELFARNVKLVDWRCAPAITPDETQLIMSEPQSEVVSSLCDEYGLTTVKKWATQMMDLRSGWAHHWPAIEECFGYF